MKMFFVGYLIAIGLSELQFRKARAQVVWNPEDTPKEQPSHVIWRHLYGLRSLINLQKWEIVPSFDGIRPIGGDLKYLNDDEALIFHRKELN